MLGLGKAQSTFNIIWRYFSVSLWFLSVLRHFLQKYLLSMKCHVMLCLIVYTLCQFKSVKTYLCLLSIQFWTLSDSLQLLWLNFGSFVLKFIYQIWRVLTKRVSFKWRWLVKLYFHFHQNLRISSFRDSLQTLGGAGGAMFPERQIEYLRDWADLESRGHQAGGFLLSLPAIHQFNCHRQNIFWHLII